MRNAGIVCALAVFCCAGCVSLVEKAGRAVDGSAFAEKKTAVYRTDDIELNEMQNKAGGVSVVIKLKKYPAMSLRGSAPDAAGEFYLTSRDYLGGNAQGWNEYRLDLSGSGRLVLGESEARLSFQEEIEPVGISWGRIRRYDTRFTGSEAVSSLRNRYERIIALVEWMNSNGSAPPLPDQDEFEKYWKPFLFPELASKKKKPEGWLMDGDAYERAEDIRWNTSYTGRTFPEELWSIRNSGTMLRDWEEAIQWIYIEYEWGRIMQLLAKETTLARAKK